MRLQFSIAAFALFGFSLFAQQPQTEVGSIKHLEKFESKLVQPRDIDIWFPADYNPKEKYAVLYMHDGQNLFDPSKTWNKLAWEVDDTAGRLMKAGAVKKFIVVGISNVPDLRFSDYFPQKPFESLTAKSKDSIYGLYFGEKQMFNAKVGSDAYLKFIVTELKPFIDKTFPTKTDAANTFIAGSSMGGLISWYAVCEYPEVFGGAACLSTHWIGATGVAQNPIPPAFLKYFDKKLPSPSNHKFYFDHGTEGLDANYAVFQNKADAILQKHGYTAKNLISKEFPGDDHNEKAWASRFEQPLLLFFGTAPKVTPAPATKASDKKAASSGKTTAPEAKKQAAPATATPAATTTPAATITPMK